MMSMIRHRGPDESGIYVDGGIGLGHVRLSIIDLGRGGQPMGNEDGSLWIVYNGELYNYLELRQELMGLGHRFSTQSDTEVVLHLYEELGAGCLDLMNGQFAFAIWDQRSKELFLARDRVGIRPLYWADTGREFIFASEIKAILLHPRVSRLIDPFALGEVFTYWTTLNGRTVFEGIQQLQPGCYMKLSRARREEVKYWNICAPVTAETEFQSIEDAGEKAAFLLKDAVRLRLRADVPVGAYMSGGLDSSIVTALTCRYFDNRLNSFSMAFEDQDYDERRFQARFLTRFGVDHREALIKTSSIRSNFPDTVWHCEIPVLRTAPVPLFMLSHLVRGSGYKVVLTGEGSDEVFGGYNIFKEAKVRAFCAKEPESVLRPLLFQRLYPYVFRDGSRIRAMLEKFYATGLDEPAEPFFSHRIRWRNGRKLRAFFSVEVSSAFSEKEAERNLLSLMPDDFARLDPLKRAQILEMWVFMSNYLLSSQGDRVAMAHSVEIRLPFLDHRIVEFGMRLPSRWKIRGLNEKYILKKAFGDLLPEDIIKRPKQPYRAPVREVFIGDREGDYVEEVLSEGSIKRAGYFDPKKVGFLVRKLRNARPGYRNELDDMALAGIVSTQLVHFQFIEAFPYKRVEPIRPDTIIERKFRKSISKPL